MNTDRPSDYEGEIRQAGDLLAAINDLRDEVRVLSRRTADTTRPKTSVSHGELLGAVHRLGPVDLATLAAYLQVPDDLAQAALSSVANVDGDVMQLPNGSWTISPPKIADG